MHLPIEYWKTTLASLGMRVERPAPRHSRSRQAVAPPRWRGALGLEQLELRSMMAVWGTQFEFNYIVDPDAVPPPEGIVADTRVVTLPTDVALPATLFVSWSVDDDVRVNGTQLGTGTAGSGSTTLVVSSRDVTFELLNFYAPIFGGRVTVVATPDSGTDGEPCGGCPTMGPTDGDGVLRHFDGPALSIDGFGLQRDSTDGSSGAAGSLFGNGWSRSATPTLSVFGEDVSNPTYVALSFGGTDDRVYRNVSPSGASPNFERAGGQGSTDRLTVSDGRFVFRTAAGSTLTFEGYEASAPAARGQLISREDASGNRVEYSINADGITSTITRHLAGVSTAQQVETYTYLPATDPDNPGKVSHIDITRGDGTPIRSVAFAYYGSSASFGTLGDLASVTVRDAAGSLVDARNYRYTTSSSGGSLLQYTFDFDAVRRATAAGLNLATASNSAVAPFANNYYEYDTNNRVTRRDVQGVGCSSCSGGIGTFTYSYATNASPTPGNNQEWRTKTTETRPDGTQRIVYSNARMQPMLEVIRTTEGGVTKQYGTYTRYDDRGQAIWRASPEAIALPTNLADLEAYPDLLHETSGNFQYISDSTGLIEVTNYGSATTATATTAGTVDRFVSSTAVMRGELGTPALQQSFTYFVMSDLDNNTFMPVASRTTYPNASPSGAQTTTYAYTFVSGTTQIVSQQTTLPVVSSSQNGPGTADVTSRVFDAAGRVIWSKDGDGFLRYTQYDAATGAVVKSIVDVDTSRFQNLPSGWATPSGGGLHLVTTYGVDSLGRTVKANDPQGNVTYIVYDDVNHSSRTYRGWNSVTNLPTGPIELARRDLSGTYTETLTYSATPAVDAQGRPTGTEAITGLQSLSRSIVNAAGQVIAVDRYTDFSGLTYSTTTATLGTEGVNYLRTRYAYNNQGQVERVQNPAGTITISTYDGRARLTGTWVGTNDSTTDGFKWKPSNASPASNMVQVAAYEYDNGGTGNSNLTQSTQFPGGGEAPRVTRYAYDWQNRLVAAKSGGSSNLATESTSVNRPLSYTDYDNLGRITGSSVYDGDGIWVADANADGVPDKPAASLLRSAQISLYDTQNRVYSTQQLFVDQATGAVGSAALTTNLFYDLRGNVAAVYAPNGPVTQSRYDGAGRLTTSYTLGNVPSATWANATSNAASLVLEQTEYSYDAAGNVVLTANRQRFDDASTTAFGDLGTPTTGIPARVSYAASYYDAAYRLTASVNVGTNGGTAYTRPSTVSARSDTALVTTYAYDAAGRVQDVTDPNGITARTLYDALGRQTASIANYTGGAPAAQSDVTTLFTFDSAGRLASRTAVQPTGTPSQVTGYVYGVSPATGSTITSNDVMAETRYPDPATGVPSASERDIYTTNALGERISFTDRAGTTHSYAYAVTGRQTADAVTALGTGVDGAVRRIETAYDTLGNVASITSFNSSTAGTALNQVARVYNGFGQMTSEWQSHTGVVDTATTPRVQYGYSQGVGGNHSRLTQITYPDGYAVTYDYSGIDDAVSRPTSVSGQRANSTTIALLETFKYLGRDTVIERWQPEVTSRLSMVNVLGVPGDVGDKYTGLDRFGRVVEQRWTRGQSTGSPWRIDHTTYTYDRNGNRLTRTNAFSAAFSETYSYDALNQLQSFARGTTSSPTTTQGWEFDALGNWTAVTTNGVAESRTANAQNELTQVGSAALTYSPTGNLTTDAQGRTLSYDAWNRLVSVQNAASTQVARYEYDGLNRRIVEQTGTLASPAAASAPVRDIYFSRDWQALEERVRTSTGAIPATADTRYLWSPVYVDAMIARDRNADGNTATGTGGLEQRVYAVQDANWNTTAIIAATGVPGTVVGLILSRFIYSPYGDVQVLTRLWETPAAGSTPAAPWSHLFQGLKFTDVTGLAYVRHRDYSPSLGRFIERDPIGFDAGDNNWYRFVGNGPTVRTDPSGLVSLAGGGWEPGATTISGINPTITVIPPHGTPYVSPPFEPGRGRNGERSCIGPYNTPTPQRPVVQGYVFNFSFVIFGGASISRYHLWDSEGREATFVYTSGRAGWQGDLSVALVQWSGTLSEFLETDSDDFSIGFLCGVGGSLGSNAENRGVTIGLGLGAGATYKIGPGKIDQLWKNF
jgi:RHS repeat-associated protein